MKIKNKTIMVIKRKNFKKIKLFGCIIQFNFGKDFLGCIYITHLKSGVCHYIDIGDPRASNWWLDDRYSE